MVNQILSNGTKPLADGPTSPVMVSKGEPPPFRERVDRAISPLYVVKYGS